MNHNIPGRGGAGAGGRRLECAAGGLCAGRTRARSGADRSASGAVGVAVLGAHPAEAEPALSLSLSRGRAAVAVEGTDRLSTVVSEEGSANQNPDRRLRDFLN